MSKIFVKQTEITIIIKDKSDYISLTDIVRNMPNSYSVIGHWLRLKDTIEYLGLWEKLNNPNFKLTEFGEFTQNAGLNRFTLSPQQWVNKTGAIGIISKSGKYGGTYAHKDIAFHFAMWLSPEFHLLIVKEFQRLKDQEQKLLNPEWDYRRFLSKVNYRLQTDSIKENIIPHFHLSKEQEGYVYANEAEILNVAVFGMTSKQWRENNPKETLEGYNIRDYADIPQLTVIANLETLNSHFIKQQVSPKERLEKLKLEAISQLKSLMNYKYTYPIESPRKYEQTSTYDNKLNGLLNLPPDKNK